MRARIIFLAALLLAGKTQAPWFGTWAFNAARSTPSADARFKRMTTTIEPAADGLKVIYDIVGLRGGVTHMEWSGKFDGRDYPVQGVDYVLTNAYTLLGDRRYQIVIKVDGAVAATAVVEISSDGQTLTTLTTQKDSRGQTITTKAVYDRQ
jgi:hypothetical protein